MNRKGWLVVAALAAGVLLVTGLALTAAAKEVPRITKEEVKEKLGDPDVVIIDVRLGSDWNASDIKIKGAVREESRLLKEWAGKYDKEKTLVIYCA